MGQARGIFEGPFRPEYFRICPIVDESGPKAVEGYRTPGRFGRCLRHPQCAERPGVSQSPGALAMQNGGGAAFQKSAPNFNFNLNRNPSLALSDGKTIRIRIKIRIRRRTRPIL